MGISLLSPDSLAYREAPSFRALLRDPNVRTLLREGCRFSLAASLPFEASDSDRRTRRGKEVRAELEGAISLLLRTNV